MSIKTKEIMNSEGKIMKQKRLQISLVVHCQMKKKLFSLLAFKYFVIYKKYGYCKTV